MAKLTPAIIAAKRDRARQCMAKYDFGRAVFILRELESKGMSDGQFFLELAEALRADGDIAGACATLERVVKIYTGNALLRARAGQLLLAMHRPVPAVALLGAVDPADDTTGAVRLALADWYERTGRRDAARALAEEVLSAVPDSDSARRVFAMNAPGLDERIAELSDFLVSEPKDREAALRAGCALVTAHDAAGDFASAMRVLAETKLRIETDFAKELVGFRERGAATRACIQKSLTELTPALVRRWRDEAAREPAPKVAMLVGHPRSGTTLLESILDAHPGLVSVEESVFMETGFVHGAGFTAGDTLYDVAAVDRLPREVVSKSVARYLKSMRGYPEEPVGDRFVLDKNPILTRFLGVAARYLPGIKTLVALRDPRDVCLSCHRLSVTPNPVNTPWLTMADTVAQYVEIMAVWLRMRELLPSEDWHEVRYEKLVDDVAAEAAAAQRFLGLDFDAGTLDYHLPEKRRAVFSPTYADAAKPIYRRALNHWERYAPIVEPHLATLAPTLKALGYS